jgi:hypothetical protein
MHLTWWGACLEHYDIISCPSHFSSLLICIFSFSWVVVHAMSTWGQYLEIVILKCLDNITSIKHDRIQHLARGSSQQGLGYQAKTVSWGKLLIVKGDASDMSSARFKRDNTILMSFLIKYKSSSEWRQLQMLHSDVESKIVASIGSMRAVLLVGSQYYNNDEEFCRNCLEKMHMTGNGRKGGSTEVVK